MSDAPDDNDEIEKRRWRDWSVVFGRADP